MVSLSQHWNTRHLTSPQPQLVLVQMHPHVADCLRRCIAVLATALDVLKDEAFLSSDGAILSRLLEKRRSQLRIHKTRQALSRVDCCLKRYHEHSLQKLIQALLQDLQQGRTSLQTGGVVRLPSSAQFQHLLCSVISFTALLVQTVNYCVEATVKLEMDVNLAHILPHTMMCLATVSRIWACCQSLFLDGVSWYRQLLPMMHLFPAGDQWLSEESTFPEDLPTWLGERMSIGNMSRERKWRKYKSTEDTGAPTICGDSLQERGENVLLDGEDIGASVEISREEMGITMFSGSAKKTKKKKKKPQNVDVDSRPCRDMQFDTLAALKNALLACKKCDKLMKLFLTLKPQKTKVKQVWDQSPKVKYKKKLHLYEKKLEQIKKCKIEMESSAEDFAEALAKAKRHCMVYVKKISTMRKKDCPSLVTPDMLKECVRKLSQGEGQLQWSGSTVQLTQEDGETLSKRLTILARKMDKVKDSNAVKFGVLRKKAVLLLTEYMAEAVSQHDQAGEQVVQLTDNHLKIMENRSKKKCRAGDLNTGDVKEGSGAKRLGKKRSKENSSDQTATVKKARDSNFAASAKVVKGKVSKCAKATKVEKSGNVKKGKHFKCAKSAIVGKCKDSNCAKSATVKKVRDVKCAKSANVKKGKGFKRAK